MTVYIKAYGPVGIVIENNPQFINGEYLKWYDPEAFRGQGDAKFTLDKAQALTFESKAKAMEFAFQTPVMRPLRRDGKPNRPLLAFTLEFVEE